MEVEETYLRWVYLKKSPRTYSNTPSGHWHNRKALVHSSAHTADTLSCPVLFSPNHVISLFLMHAIRAITSPLCRVAGLTWSVRKEKTFISTFFLTRFEMGTGKEEEYNSASHAEAESPGLETARGHSTCTSGLSEWAHQMDTSKRHVPHLPDNHHTRGQMVQMGSHWRKVNTGHEGQWG